MTSIENPASSSIQPAPAVGGARSGAADLIRRPVALFVLLSTLFGIPAVFLIPPLRGADEPAHFLRAYGISRGEMIPSLTDTQGRRGIFLPARLNEDFQFFEAARYRFKNDGLTYRDVFAEYRRRGNVADPAGPPLPPPVFVLYAGSEGYSPAAYLPYVPAVIAGRVLGLDFLPMLWLMRLAGFIAMTAVAAYAIAVVPHLKWAFLFIAMLPIALYERVIVSADGAALSFAMVVTALCLRAAAGQGREPPWQRSLWMTLCVLAKPSQTAFIVLEAMTRPLTHLLGCWRTFVAIAAPGLILTLLYLIVASADIAAWRMIEGTGAPPEHFNIGWKLKFLIEHPHHFLSASLGKLAEAYDLWREAIGGLGWRDTHLPLPIYVFLTVMFLASCLARLELDARTRLRVAAVAGLSLLCYWLAIFLIFYLAWTPIDAHFVHGVQGRYFTIVLPPAALMIAALVNRAPRQWITATVAAAGAIVSGAAMIDAVVRSQW
jgi:Predicted membrane protein (DUF2142)